MGLLPRPHVGPRPDCRPGRDAGRAVGGTAMSLLVSLLLILGAGALALLAVAALSAAIAVLYGATCDRDPLEELY